MKEKKNRTILIVYASILMVLASVTGFLSSGQNGERGIAKRFQRSLSNAEQLTGECVANLGHDIESALFYDNYFEGKNYRKASKNGITLLVYTDGRLQHWSDNSFDIPREYDKEIFGGPKLFLQNGWFLPVTIERQGYTIVGLLRLTTDYGFENEIIKSGFTETFKLPEGVGLNTSKSVSGTDITNNEGEFLFSLDFPETTKNPKLSALSLVCWLLALLAVLVLVTGLARYFRDKGMALTGVFICLSLLLGLYSLSVLFEIPALFYGMELFSPLLFSVNSFIPSLGHLLAMGIIVFIVTLVFYRNIAIKPASTEEGLKGGISFTLLLFAGVLLLCFGHYLFTKVLTESNINLEFYKILDVSYYTVAAFVAIILFFFSSFWLILKAVQSVPNGSLKSMVLPIIMSLSVVMILFWGNLFSLMSVVFFLVVQLITAYLVSGKTMAIFNLSIICSLIFSVYALITITIYSGNRTDEKIKIQALAFSVENDPEAELLLLDMWPKIKADSVLNDMMDVERFDNDDYLEINDYLHEIYFSGYWANYNVGIYLCEKGQPLQLGEEGGVTEDCFGFFDAMIEKDGGRLTGTDFFFIENNTGRTSYMGKFYFNGQGGRRTGLFIELFGDINVFQPGYSELLLDKRYHRYSGLNDYSFIKYINGQTAVSYGDYDYKTNDLGYLDKSGQTDYTIFEEGGHRHVLYRNGDTTVIISRPALSLSNLLISFAYLFAFSLLLVNLAIALTKGYPFFGPITLKLRQKFQIAIIAILLVTSIFVGFLVANLTINRYESNHYDNIKEKIQSVSVALNYNFNGLDFISTLEEGTTVNQRLIDLSNVFNTDINFYDLRGELIATSRPEIFNRNLVGTIMDNDALINLSENSKTGFTHTETVGNMKYISSYAPYYDSSGQLVAYLNLPYFRMQSSFAKEISDLIVAVVNFTLLLVILSMSIAVIIVGRLTAPLSMLSKGLASVELGKKAEHIFYGDDDEVGDLIKQYNLMVDELGESAVKLANSEREYAWREMAKQIAHEIKNPLTPMKLNVQQLHKSFKDNIPDFDKRMDNFAKNQIEYIDNLSSIASAFSSFAKLPANNPTRVDLVEQIKTTLDLFRNSLNIIFTEEWPTESKVYVFADREQLNGIFSNLIKNGIQSIPSGKEGTINISMKVLRDKTLIAVSDNGTGIPNIIKDKLFTPNFTTKSSGTGLGLSIVKKYVENIGGTIWFESVNDVGTTFFVELPLMFTVESNNNLIT